jgi:hypothetical protein
VWGGEEYYSPEHVAETTKLIVGGFAVPYYLFDDEST